MINHASLQPTCRTRSACVARTNKIGWAQPAILLRRLRVGYQNKACHMILASEHVSKLFRATIIDTCTCKLNACMKLVHLWCSGLCSDVGNLNCDMQQVTSYMCTGPWPESLRCNKTWLQSSNVAEKQSRQLQSDFQKPVHNNVFVHE